MDHLQSTLQCNGRSMEGGSIHGARFCLWSERRPAEVASLMLVGQGCVAMGQLDSSRPDGTSRLGFKFNNHWQRELPR
jgi:hypothetical protein